MDNREKPHGFNANIIKLRGHNYLSRRNVNRDIYSAVISPESVEYEKEYEKYVPSRSIRREIVKEIDCNPFAK